MKQDRIRKLCVAALLWAVGILVPVISPVKITVGPMSFTLASHVAVFMAMFISPAVALSVELGTTVGFILAGFAPVVWLRAAAQVFFVLPGALWLAAAPGLMQKPAGRTFFGLVCAIIHGVAEALVVLVFWFGGMYHDAGYSMNFLIWGLVCGGTILHSMLDYFLSLLIWVPVGRMTTLPAVYRPQFRQHG